MSLFSFIKPYRRSIAFILCGIFISNILALGLPWGIKIIVDTVLTHGDQSFLETVVLVLLIVVLLRTGLNFLHKYYSSIVGEKIVADLRGFIYSHIHRLPLMRIRETAPSQLLTRISSDVDSVRRFVFGDALDFVYSVVAVVAVAIVLWFIHGRMMLCVLGVMPFFAVIYVLGVPRLKGCYGRLRDAYGVLTSRANEVLSGMATVRALGGSSYEREVFQARQQDVLQTARQSHALNTVLWISAEFFMSLGVVGVLWIGGKEVVAGRMSPGELVAFYSYLGMLLAPLIRMVAVNSAYQEAAAAWGRIEKVLCMEKIPAQVKNPVCLSKLQGDVVFEDVSFGYEPGRLALKGISFSVKPGETVAVVGPNGAGKSTLIGLILRLFDVTDGRVLIDGHDVRDLDIDVYRHQVGVVLQDDFLFHDTVAANIAYASLTVTPAQIESAARAAKAHDFIKNIPEGYAMKVGERGVFLSSGQRQRIAIARALVRCPRLLLLDEATSAIDALTENDLQFSMQEFAGKKTIFIVAHRFSTIMHADRVIVLHDGKMEDTGTHEELLGRSSFYRQLYMEQFKEAA